MQKQARRFVSRIIISPTIRVAWDKQDTKVAVYRSR